MLDVLLPIFSIMLLGMLSPGPDFILIVKNAQTSFLKAFGTAVGICLGLAIHLYLVVYGAAQVLTQIPYLNHGISLLGAFYLFWVAFKTYQEGQHQLGDIKIKKSSFIDGVKEGFICNLLNPKLILFLLSILSLYLGDIKKLNLSEIIYFSLLLEAFIVWTLFAYTMQLPLIKKLFFKYELIFSKLFALALTFFAGKIIFDVLSEIKLF